MGHPIEPDRLIPGFQLKLMIADYSDFSREAFMAAYAGDTERADNLRCKYVTVRNYVELIQRIKFKLRSLK